MSTADDRFDFDILSGKYTPRRVFTHKGITVHEYLIPWGDGSKKLLWIRDGQIEKSKVYRVVYPVFHCKVSSETSEAEALRMVTAEFESFYKSEMNQWQAVEDAAKHGAVGLKPSPKN